MDFQGYTAILADTSVEDTLSLSKAISEYGILVVIAAIFLIVTAWIFRRMINSYAKTIDGIIPKLEVISKSINDLKISINEVMSAHNAHTNQSLRTLERDSKEIREEITHYHKSLMDLDSALNSLQESYNTLLQIIIQTNGQRRSLPDSFINTHYDDNRFIHVESHDITDNKKDEDESK